MTPTSAGWPQVMRINPLLEWSYADIWLFTRLERVPVCRLYRRGFTSLGATDRTVPNPHLRIARKSDVAFLQHLADKTIVCAADDDDFDSSIAADTPQYRPAWHLIDGAHERAGRLK